MPLSSARVLTAIIARRVKAADVAFAKFINLSPPSTVASAVFPENSAGRRTRTSKVFAEDGLVRLSRPNKAISAVDYTIALLYVMLRAAQ
jgi:hypothetical protein